MQTRSFLSFTAGILVGAGVWLPIFVGASTEGDAPGWSTLVSLLLFAVAGLLNGRFERRRPRSAIRPADAAPAAVARLAPTREAASHAAHVGAFASTSRPRCSGHRQPTLARSRRPRGVPPALNECGSNDDARVDAARRKDSGAGIFG